MAHAHAAEGRLRERAAERRRHARREHVDRGADRLVPRVRRSGADAHADARAHHLGRRPNAEARDGQRRADTPAALRAARRRRGAHRDRRGGGRSSGGRGARGANQPAAGASSAAAGAAQPAPRASAWLAAASTPGAAHSLQGESHAAWEIAELVRGSGADGGVVDTRLDEARWASLKVVTTSLSAGWLRRTACRTAPTRSRHRVLRHLRRRRRPVVHRDDERRRPGLSQRAVRHELELQARAERLEVEAGALQELTRRRARQRRRQLTAHRRAARDRRAPNARG